MSEQAPPDGVETKTIHGTYSRRNLLRGGAAMAAIVMGTALEINRNKGNPRDRGFDRFKNATKTPESTQQPAAATPAVTEIPE